MFHTQFIVVYRLPGVALIFYKNFRFPVFFPSGALQGRKTQQGLWFQLSSCGSWNLQGQGVNPRGGFQGGHMLPKFATLPCKNQTKSDHVVGGWTTPRIPRIVVINQQKSLKPPTYRDLYDGQQHMIWFTVKKIRFSESSCNRAVNFCKRLRKESFVRFFYPVTPKKTEWKLPVSH